MLSKRINKSTQVNQSVQELDLDDYNQDVFEFVKECLLQLKEYHGKKYIDERVQNSNLEKILQHFSRKQSKPFTFQGERAEESKKSKGQGSQPDLSVNEYDVAVYEPNQPPFYIIECKWLKTKRVSKGKEINDFTHSNQYVKGNTGGIERFKRGLYADWLTESLIIGYVLNEDMTYWHEKVNEWIKNEIDKNSDKEKIVWCEWDLLKEDIKEELNPSFISHHIRKSNEKAEWDYICLKHLWIKMD